MNTFPFLRFSLVVAGLSLFAACSTVPLDEKGEMNATYVAGEFRMVVNSNAPTTARATSEAFKQLGLFQIKNDLRTYDADLAARTELDEKVRVRIKEINSRQTEIGIRVDMIGDKDYSRKLYQQIEKNLTVSGRAW